MRQEAHDPNGERTRLPRSIVTRTNRVKWQPKCGPTGNRCRMGMDQGDSWTTKTRIRGIHGRQKRGSGGFRGDDTVDQGIRATMLWTRSIRSTQARTGWQRSALARTWRAKIHASTDLKSKGPRKRGPEGQRSAQARAGRIKVWARESQSATRVFRATGESNRGGRIESRGPPEANRGERK